MILLPPTPTCTRADTAAAAARGAAASVAPNRKTALISFQRFSDDVFYSKKRKTEIGFCMINDN